MQGNQSAEGRRVERADGSRRDLWLIYSIASLVCVALLAWGVVERNPGYVIVALLGMVVVAAVAPLTFVLHTQSMRGRAPGMAEELGRLARSIEVLSQQAALSDDARRVLNRARERELLTHAIEEDIASEDWDAAMVLVKELAEAFGYRSEAEEYRARIDQARFETQDRRVSAAIAALDKLIVQRRWNEAMSEAARVTRLYPDSPRIEGLRHRVERSRDAYKHDVERRFLLAAKEERIDDAMELLRELDAYLTEQEGERYREVARGVIGKARDNLGAQFKLAVQDRRWAQAAEIGERIVAEFPNSRMAEEVRQVLDSLRARSAG